LSPSSDPHGGRWKLRSESKPLKTMRKAYTTITKMTERWWYTQIAQELIESRLLSLQLYSLVDIINESANYTSLRYCD